MLRSRKQLHQWCFSRSEHGNPHKSHHLLAIGYRLIFGVLIASLSWQAQAACKFFDGFKDNNNGTVTDPRNGLVWKRCAEGFTWTGSACAGSEVIVNWFDAMRAAKDSRFLGKSDWRIPTKAEVEAVVGKYDDCERNDSKNGEYAASKDIAHLPGYVWTSSPNVGSAGGAWYVNFGNGSFDYYAVRDGDSYEVRLVRASQSSGGKAASEFNNENKRVLAYDREQAAKARAQQAQESRDSQARARAAATACSRLYVGKPVGVRVPEYLFGPKRPLDAVITGIGNGQASFKIVDSVYTSHYGQRGEMSCSAY